eukprot:snap_masked-scaffold_29-processed-gene-2.43-mRNA-1 protein AED:1.00 eAED:1.00 QI:0/0/0/0/1/1/3/0/72
MYLYGEKMSTQNINSSIYKEDAGSEQTRIHMKDCGHINMKGYSSLVHILPMDNPLNKENKADQDFQHTGCVW